MKYNLLSKSKAKFANGFQKAFQGILIFKSKFPCKDDKTAQRRGSSIVFYKTIYYSNNLPNIETINFMTGMIYLVNKRIT